MGWRSGQSYSQDLRDRVIGAVDGGMAVRETAGIYKVSIAYIYNAVIRRRVTGDIGVKQNRGRPPRKLSPEQELALGAHIRPGLVSRWLKHRHGCWPSMASRFAQGRCGKRPNGSACALKS